MQHLRRVTAASLCPLRYLRYLVYKVKMKTDQYKEDTEHYLYDIFVCYSQADRQWVFEHLVARLEDGGRYVLRQGPGMRETRGRAGYEGWSDHWAPLGGTFTHYNDA